MKKRILAVVLLLVLALSLSAQATSPRIAAGRPRLSFSGTTASCLVDYKSGNSTDKLSATLTLWQGSTRVDSWTDSGTGRVTISEQCAVKSGKDYKLTLTWSLNGTAQSAVSVTGRCP